MYASKARVERFWAEADGRWPTAPCMWLLSAIAPALTANLNVNFLRRGARPGQDVLAAARLLRARQAACGRRGQPALGQIARSDRPCYPCIPFQSFRVFYGNIAP